MGNEHSSEPLSLCEVYTYYLYMLKLEHVSESYNYCACVSVVPYIQVMPVGLVWTFQHDLSAVEAVDLIR